MVLQCKSDAADPEVPDSVAAYIRKTVVWSARDLDITDSILRELNRTAINVPQRRRLASPFNNNQSPRQRREASRRRALAGRSWMAGGRGEGSFFSTLVTDDRPLWMEATRNQQTIAAPVAIAGVGYWSGRDVRVEFRPAPADTGIVFVRADLENCPRIPATVRTRVETPRRTVLRRGSASVEMIEHIMAALAGLQIDNCEVWVDQPEMPGFDGSSLPFVEVLRTAGIVPQSAVRRRQVIRRRSAWATPRVGSRPGRVARTSWSSATNLDYGSGNPIGRQSLEISLSPRHFHMNLAPSRTFVLESEVAAIKAQGLGQRVTCKDLLVFGPRGPIDNQLRFPDECVRHKMARHGRRPRFGGLRSGRPVRRLPQRSPAQRRVGPRDRCRRRSSGRFENAAPDLWRESRPWPATLPKTCSIDPRAEIDDEVEIGPFCVIGPKARIGRGTRLENNVTLMGNVTIGCYNHIFPNAVIGGEPQDISYTGSDTKVVIGDHNIIRECVTINRASEKEEGVTRIGDHNFLMACCHVAHDCQLGNHIIIANGTLLAGHVHVHDYASLSGAVAVHHFATIGSYSFVAGLSAVRHDVPPYMLVEGFPGPAPLHQRRRPETQQFLAASDPGPGRSP